jgi:stage III sporulation protein SpoIIIAA
MKTGNEINNFTELQAEILRLKNVREEQEQQIKKHILVIKEDWKPENILLNSLSSVFGVKTNRNTFFKESIAHKLSLLMQRFILKTEQKIEDKTYGFTDTLFGNIKRFLDKFINYEAKKEERNEKHEKS